MIYDKEYQNKEEMDAWAKDTMEKNRQMISSLRVSSKNM
jgi:hypothetical protein